MDYLDFELLIGGKDGGYSVNVIDSPGGQSRAPMARPCIDSRFESWLRTMQGVRGEAERSFAQLLTTAGLASINFSNQVTIEDFARLVRAFAVGGSKGQDVAKQIKETLGDGKGTSIKINEVKFVAADPATGEVTIAAQIAAQTLGPEFKQWLNDPQKLLQLIAAAEGAKGGGGGEPGGAPIGSVPTVRVAGGGGTGSGTGTGSGERQQ